MPLILQKEVLRISVSGR